MVLFSQRLQPFISVSTSLREPEAQKLHDRMSQMTLLARSPLSLTAEAVTEPAKWYKSAK
ncbi:hypothetical protein FIBSPDRAFT_862200 [Athelia psychrophila]|uniref:Uncharacterized protein n=1 Tax=Athelia psychrophila TaxID=1759441 RepID=A0A166ILU4_9AGAM|nr:hypothetical protein FIBSPDRAFT_875846 [Fibularhizoctonia sp. CBS 109695]KZP19965.1 hypothetical protein FIBSPDRAFT_862200 [Fibularhizoctonia sp. CBS 109695]